MPTATTVPVKMAQRRDTAANWTSINPTLLAGEIGLESDTGYWKVGDGSTAWNSLAYVTGLGGEIPVNRLVDGTARQLLQTAANGTDVEWTSNVDVPGTLDVTSVATFDNNVIIQGDLTVNGTTTTIDTTNLAIEDKNIEIGKVATPTDATADGGGITLKGTTDKTINWVDATDAWTFSEHVNIASGKEYRINGTKVLDATSLGSNVLITSSNITDGTIVNGDINASAAIAGTKISPDFGSQTVTTTGVISAALGAAATPSLTFTGDLNTGIYSPGADQVAISTNSTGRLFIDSSGRVGIGTTPISSVAFHLRTSTGYNVAAQTSGSSVRLNYLNDDASANVSAAYRATDFAWQKGDGTEVARIDSSGQLGIGTSGPGFKLDCRGEGFFGTDLNNGIRFNPSAGVGGTNYIQSGVNGAAGPLHLGNWYGNGFMVIDSSGRVGIGTTSPSANLHISSGGNTEAVIDASSAGSPILSMLATGAGSGIVAYQNQLRFGTATGVGATGYSERARFDSSGRLLVGTSTALTGTDTQYSRLVVTGNTSGASAGIMSISRPEAATSITTDEVLGAICFADSGAGEYGRISCVADANAGTNDYPGRLVFSTTADGASSPTERMRITQSGRITLGGQTNEYGHLTFANGTVGTTNSMIWLNLTNTAHYYLQFEYNSGGRIGSITTNGTAVAFNTSSDYRLKENIAPVVDGIERLKQLKPSRFNFISHPEKTVDGFIAHEVQAIVPEAINGEKDAIDEDGKPLYQGIDQSKLVPLLTAALQEAIAKIEALEARLTAAGI